MKKLKHFFDSYYIRSYLIIFICTLLVELIFRIISGLSIVSFSMLRIFLFLNIISCIFAYLLNYTVSVFRKIFTIIIVSFSTIYSIAQLGFHNYLGVYMSLQTSSQFDAVVDYIKEFIASFKITYFIPVVVIIGCILFAIFFDRKARRLGFIKSTVISLIILIVCVPLYCYLSFNSKFEGKFQTVSNYKIWYTASNPSVTVDQFGINGFLFLDIKAILLPKTIEDEYVAVTSGSTTEEVQTNYTRVIDDKAWNEVISEETDSTYNTLNNYFINRTITDKNDYTGLFEGKNLIVIMMESADDILINPEYYPNFYRLVTGGWYWENNYSPRNSCATMNNEFSGMTSLYSIYNTCTANIYKSNKYYEAIFNLFDNKHYSTFSAHDYTEAYYYRSVIHPNMGSQKYYGVQQLGIDYSDEYINWANDDEFMQAVLDILDSEDLTSGNFMTWLTTVSSHMPYTVSSTQGDMYYDMTEGTDYSSDVRRYMSKLKILDNALGVLIDGLESRGILDDTVIVLYGDHYPYGLSTSHINEVLDYDTSVDLDAERVPFVIFNSEVTESNPQVFEDYTYYLNILPTLANLFNLDYDPRLYLGTDLFSDDYESMVVFADGSWKNEIAYYNATKNSIKYYTNVTYTDDEINAINSNIQQEINASTTAIKSNYFNYLDNALSNKKNALNQINICYNDDKESYSIE